MDLIHQLFWKNDINHSIKINRKYKHLLQIKIYPSCNDHEKFFFTHENDYWEFHMATKNKIIII